MPASARHETRALLRAHLSAATGIRHLTPRCPICHQLKRLAMEPSQLPATGPVLSPVVRPAVLPAVRPAIDPAAGPVTAPENQDPDCPLQGLGPDDDGPHEG